MDELDEPLLPYGGKIKPDESNLPSTEERLRSLVQSQLYGVLCTQANNQPYGSMVAFAFSDDLSHFLFVTATATRKYRLLSECRNVALVVNNLTDFPNDMMQVEAFTVTGKAREATAEDIDAELLGSFKSRHPQLRSFVEAPSTAVFVVKAVRYFLVSSFQEVREWSPAGKTD